MVDRSAVIVAESFSSTFAQVKATLDFKGKSLIRHVIDAVSPIADEVIVVTQSEEQAKKYAECLEPDTRFAINPNDIQGHLGAALAGFEASKEKSSLLLSSDYLLVSPIVVDLLFEMCPGKTAVVPRWPNQQTEPLHSVYHTKSALKAGQIALEDGLFSLDALIENLGGVRYVSTLAIQEFDPELKTFFKVETPLDLKMAETLAKEKPWKLREKRKR